MIDIFLANWKELDAVTDYCCFTVAIVMARLQIDFDNINEQWSSTSLCEKLNLLPYTDGPNFFINSSALSHGLIIFQRTLRYVGLQSIPICQEGKAVLPYFSLNYSRMSIQMQCGLQSSYRRRGFTIRHFIETEFHVKKV